MNSLTATPAPVKSKRPVRTLAVLHPITPNGGGVVRITEGKVSDTYLVEPLDSCFDVASRWTKEGDENHPGYDVLVNPEMGYHSCECLGFLRHNHCRHVEAAVVLLARGQLPAPAAATERTVQHV
jgi:hypothetical protein